MWRLLLILTHLILVVSCEKSETIAQPAVGPRGNEDVDKTFKLWVANKSQIIDSVNLIIRVNGNVVCEEYIPYVVKFIWRFDNEVSIASSEGHDYKCFELDLPEGLNSISVESKNGEAKFAGEFDTNNADYGVLTYHFSDLDKPPEIKFRAKEGEISIF